jgi:CheY-like chemotaxis protein
VTVRIGDSGPGIPPEIRDRIFEPFVTTKKAAGRRGAGLGLSVAYRIARDHEAGIDVDSIPGEGSVFTLYFPVGKGAANEAESAAGGAPVAAEAPGAGRGSIECNKERILVVDDEPTILTLFQSILASGLPDRKIDVAANGREAVDLFLKEHHGVLILDLHMPVMDGHAAFCEMEKACRERNWKMPAVVFCTGFAPPRTIRSIVSAGRVHGLLSKPIGGDVLLEAVRLRLAL